MSISPSNGADFDLIRTDGLLAIEESVEEDVIYASMLGPALDNSETDLAVRDVVHGLTGDPRLFRWRRGELLDHLDDRLGATVFLFADRAEAQPVMRTTEVGTTTAAPATVVLPPPRARSDRGADPSPAAQAFKDASDSGAATVCKGPCEACGKL